MNEMSRRRFIRLLMGGAAISLLAGCGPQQPPAGTPAGTAVPLVRRRPAVRLSNDDPPNFYVRYYKSFEAVDPAAWTLSVEGMVKKPMSLSLADVQSLPAVSQLSRMKCVECWSAAAKWEGFRLPALMQQVEPQPEADWVHFYCADDYFESIKVEELKMERALFVYRMDDQMLPDPYGAPLRLIVPWKYGYKGPKAITRIVFANQQLDGFWPKAGGYSTVGTIAEGYDHPLDLSGGSRRIDGGEVRYPDGREGQG